MLAAANLDAVLDAVPGRLCGGLDVNADAAAVPWPIKRPSVTGKLRPRGAHPSVIPSTVAEEMKRSVDEEVEDEATLASLAGDDFKLDPDVSGRHRHRPIV